MAISTDSTSIEQDSERLFVASVAVGFALILLVPYLIANLMAGGLDYLWINHNVADHTVYLAWIRQAQEGERLFANRFTTMPQQGVAINLFFLALGTLSRLTGLTPMFWSHASRIVAALVFVPILYSLLRFTISSRRQRRVSLFMVLVSAGFGWTFWLAGFDLTRLERVPVDLWQPEAVTFLCFYINPLFAVSMVLIVGTICCLLRARDGSLWWGVAAGVQLLVLGNIHSYDYLHIAMAWGVYLIFVTVRMRRLDRKMIGSGTLAFLIGLPSVAYQFYLYRTEPVFRMRALVPTLSPPIIYYALGFGLLTFGTLVLGLLLWRRDQPADNSAPAHIRDRLTEADSHLPRRGIAFFFCWSVGGMLAAYLPLAFQRKMIMGSHVALAALFSIFLVAAVARYVRPGWRNGMLAAVLLFAAIGNVKWIQRDLNLIGQQIALVDSTKGSGTLEGRLVEGRSVITSAESQMLHWIEHRTPQHAAVLAPPTFARLVPALAGRFVYCGHWGETPNFEQKQRNVFRFFNRSASGMERRALLAEARVSHVAAYRSPADRPLVWQGDTLEDFAEGKESWLRPVYSNSEMIAYEIVAAESNARGRPGGP